MRIGLVSKFGAADGLCTRANAVIRGLLEKGHEVYAFTQSDRVSHLPPERVHRIPGFHLNPHFSLDAPTAVRMIAEKSQEYELDLLHIQMNSGSTEFLLPRFKHALPPLVVTYHLAYAAGATRYTGLFAIAWKASLMASKGYDQIVLVDPSQKPYFLIGGIPKDRISVIANGVDTSLFKPMDAKKKDYEVTNFVYVGRLSFDKGVSILLDAFEQYNSENPKSRLTLVGDGMLKTRIADHSHNGSIRWLGTVSHELLPSILQKSDVFVIPQNIGGLGLSVIEAMSCGLPVITTAIGETKRLLTSDEGVLVEPHSRKSVVDAMRLLGQDEELCKSMGQRCRNKVVHEYSWENQVTLLEKVYERAISGKLD